MPDDTAARRKLSHEIFDRLGAAIASGEFGPGTQVPSERALMARFGVGRPVIREAMQRLQAQGLLRIGHGERARVVTPTAAGLFESISAAMVQSLAADPGRLDELKDARTLFEVGMVRLAAERASPEGVAPLRAALAACIAARGDPAAFVEADMAFHAQIAALSGNGLLAAVSRGMLAWLSRFKREMVSVPGADQVTLDEHARIVACVAARDPDAAAAAMSDHLRRANALYAVLAAQAQPRRSLSPAQPPPPG